jgi:hypothetical protein
LGGGKGIRRLETSAAPHEVFSFAFSVSQLNNSLFPLIALKVNEEPTRAAA